MAVTGNRLPQVFHQDLPQGFKSRGEDTQALQGRFRACEEGEFEFEQGIQMPESAPGDGRSGRFVMCTR